MTKSARSSRSAKLQGSQEPSERIAPRYNNSDGFDAIKAVRVGGTILDPWQADILEDWLARTASKRWAYGSLKQSPTGAKVPGVAQRLTKQAAADTSMKNAIRDGAYWSWVPYGSETCAFCITLASQGYVKASKKVLQGNHATHIHENCKCEFVITFGNAGIEGFDPEKYSDMYYSYGGDIKEMRRDLDAQNRDKINAQHREARFKRTHFKTGEMPSGEFAIAKELWHTVKEVDIPQSEKEYVYEELDNNLSDDERESAVVTRNIGNYRYRAVHLGHNQYKIYGKEPIEPQKDIEDEVMSEIFGSDWKKYDQ